MEDRTLKCPLCCNQTFSSKPALADHLANILANLTCSICNSKWSSLNNFIEHLTLENCQPEYETETIVFDMSSENDIDEITAENSNCSLEQFADPKLLENDSVQNKQSEEFTTDIAQENVDGSELGKMYVELLSKQLTKPCLQTQELKLVQDNGVSRYVILTNEDSNMSVGSTVVTKQNNDGTISLTTIKDMKAESESDTVITQENDAENNQEEIYSCNTCGVSFTSVSEHIQNYHNDQEVVVEEPMEENCPETFDVEFEDPLLCKQSETDDKQASRRMITDTGDIVETPLVLKTTSITLDSSKATDKEKPLPTIKEEVVDKVGRLYTRRYVQVEKFCESVVKNIKQPDDKNGPYHKVVVKEMRAHDGQSVKVYHCMSCNIYVATLDEFKTHPCKVLKYTCPHCPVSYENSKSLCAHMKVHKAKPGTDILAVPATFECAICSTIFPTNKSLKLHKRMHDPIKARPLEPPVESPEGTEVSQDRYQCSVCNKIIPIDYRTVHQNSHKDAEQFHCDICNKKFNSSEYLEMHMNVHSIEKVAVGKQDKSLPYTCSYCDRRFARPHEKVKHERIHTGEKPHSCEICGKTFRVSYCLTLHMRTHTGARPYACAHCGKRFKAYSVYNHHLQTHSDVRAYKCPYCPKAFKTSVQLAGHKNSHTKPFSCQQCNRPFASLYAVRMHTETHARQNNLKFWCTQCGASYARAFALKDHVRQVHKQELDAVGTREVPSLKNADADTDADWAVTSAGDVADNEENRLAKQEQLL